jgi:hypothetical protein
LRDFVALATPIFTLHAELRHATPAPAMRIFIHAIDLIFIDFTEDYFAMPLCFSLCVSLFAFFTGCQPRHFHCAAAFHTASFMPGFERFLR